MSIIQPVGAVRTLAIGDLRDVVLSPNGVTAYVSNSDGWITALNVLTGNLVGRWKVGDQLGGMDVSSDGRYLVVTEGKVANAAGDDSDYSGTIIVHLLDLTTGLIKDFTNPVTGNERGFFDAAFTDDGKVIFTQTGEWLPLTTLDLITGIFTQSGKYSQDGVLSSAVKGGKILFAPQDISDAPLLVYSSTSDKIIYNRGLYLDGVSGFNSGYQSISNDGKFVAQSLSGGLYIFDGELKLVANLRVLHPELGELKPVINLGLPNLEFKSGISGVDFSADGRSLFVMDANNDRILELSTSDWSILRAISISVDIEANAFWGGAYGDRLTASADGSSLVVFAANSIIAINLLTVIPDGGTDRADTLNGSSGSDKLDGLGGADLLTGLGGADTLLGGRGDDTLIGGDGDDHLDGEAGDSDWASYRSAEFGVSVNLGFSSVQDTLAAGRDLLLNIENLEGTAFGDSLTGNARANVLQGGLGADTLAGSDGADTLLGGVGDDLLNGDGGDDVLDGGDGLDMASYASAVASVAVDLTLIGAQNTRAAGFDSLTQIESLKGSNYGDDLKGDAGANTLSGGAGDDLLDGRGGADRLDGGAGNNTLNGGAGLDTVVYSDFITAVTVDLSVSGQQSTGQGSDTLISIENIGGSQFGDVLRGDGGANRLDGGLGDDTLAGGLGDDTLVGGGGFDTADYASAASAVSVDLAVTVGQSTGQGLDSLSGIESVLGSQFADVLKGDAGANRLDGGQGADLIFSFDGDDLLIGGAGADQLSGGVGHDVFRGALDDLAGDTITDFSADDVINITGVDLANFTYDRNGATVTLSGGVTLSLANSPRGSLVAASDGQGGVNLTLVDSDAARNDFNGDGRSDLAWREAGGMFSTWLMAAGNGPLAVTPNQFVTGGLDNSWALGAAADFNGDGKSDLLWRNADGAFSLWNSTGTGFTVNAVVDGSVSADWSLAATGDFNGDGKADLIFRHEGGTFTEWQSTGTGFNKNVYVNGGVDAAWSLAGVGDFNGDGRDDLVWRHDGGTFSLWTSTGDGFAANTVVDGSVSADWALAAIADFNGDGKDDLIWRHAGGIFTEWRSNGAGFDQNVYVDGRVTPDWSLESTGDFNGDGKADLLWRHDTGMFTVWQSTGDSFVLNALVDTSVSPNWALASADYALV